MSPHLLWKMGLLDLSPGCSRPCKTTRGQQSALLRGCGDKNGGQQYSRVRPVPPPGSRSHAPCVHGRLGFMARVQADRGPGGDSGDPRDLVGSPTAKSPRGAWIPSSVSQRTLSKLLTTP